MRRGLIIGAAAILLAWCAGENQAQAQYMGGWGYAGNLSYPFYISERMPFYTRNPPVYYSFPQARTYGQSPFAYPPTYHEARDYRPRRFVSSHALTQPVEAVAQAPMLPVIIKNPFVN